MRAPDSPPRRRAVLAAVLFAMGVVGVGLLVRQVGAARVAGAFRSLAAVIPLLVLLEGVRIALDAWTTQRLYASAGKRAPWSPLLKAQLMSYPLVLLLPAGRAPGEGLKAVLMRRFVGFERAGAAGLMNQALPLLATFVISVPAVVVAWTRWSHHPFRFAVAAQMATALGLALLIVTGARRREVSGLLRRLSQRLGTHIDAVQQTFRALGWLPPAPLALAITNRMVLALELALLATAGTGAFDGVRSLSLLGAHLVGAAVGNMIPAQLGATDGALTLVAEVLRVTPAQAIAIAIAFHTVQLGWALIGGLAAWAWRR